MTRPDLAAEVAMLGPAELVEFVRAATERAIELGQVELLDALAETLTAARGDVVTRSWAPTEPVPTAAPRGA